MRALYTVLLCATLSSWSGAQTTRAAPAKPASDSLPSVTIQFRAVGNPLPISPEDIFRGYPVCSSSGTTFLDVVHHPGYVDQALVGVSPKAEVNTYRIGAAPGLVNAHVESVDAADSDVYALVTAERADILREHDIDPASADAETAYRYYRYYILHFGPNLASPDEIPIDLPFRPMRLAVTDPDKMTILGFDPANESPVLAVIDHQGQLVREIDTNGSFGSTAQIVAGAPQGQGDQSQSVPDTGAQLQWALSAAQWVHYGDSLLFLVPGPHARVVTLRSDGEIQGTNLRLPQGLEALSLVSSDSQWFVRVTQGAATGNLMNRTMLLMADPSNGSILQIIRTPQLSPIDISCVRDGKYYAIHWMGDKDNLRSFLMVGTP